MKEFIKKFYFTLKEQSNGSDLQAIATILMLLFAYLIIIFFIFLYPKLLFIIVPIVLLLIWLGKLRKKAEDLKNKQQEFEKLENDKNNNLNKIFVNAFTKQIEIPKKVSRNYKILKQFLSVVYVSLSILVLGIAALILHSKYIIIKFIIAIIVFVIIPLIAYIRKR